MFLNYLLITDYLNNEIRKVNFNPKGLNLIVGINNKSGTTNNIGKTTLIRCIDFCLNGKLEQLYIDKEFKNSINEDIFNFFRTKQPTFELSFKDPIEETIYKVSRKIIYENEKFNFENVITINNVKIEADFNVELKKILFNSMTERPSLRELIPKFIRKDEQQISNVLKYLHQTTSYAKYEKIHLFLFGFNAKRILQSKSELELDLKRKKKAKDALGSRFNATDLKQILEITKKDLVRLINQRDKFELDDKYELEEKQLKEIQLNIIKIEKEISNLNLKRTININKLKELNDGIFNGDTKTLRLLYDEAKFYSKDLSKSFDDVVTFHNKMIKNEIDYVSSKVEELEIEIEKLVVNRSILSKDYSELMKKLSKTGSLAEYTKLNEQIEKLAEKKGQDKKLLDELAELESEISTINKSLEKIKIELDKNLKDFNEKLAIFNESFSNYSKLLYDTEFFVSYDPEEDPIKFYTKNVGGNEGSGKKQAIVSAFDLAYIDFITKLNFNFPHFLAHDKVELIDINKLEILFDISNNINGQFIVPIIYDKIEQSYSKYKENGNIILELSENEKFFKI
ncbi:AAA family ATPase [Aliarcobacter cryaerophilus]|uniref:hypothetical protein n=1 Tax=Aliarcobacter cryaerophilus TaxID=28198 RepID=UPI003DA4C477